jgi:hypothetical protein
MDLIDRLRPRWRHPDPEIRAAAVRELDVEMHRLGAIAREDPDPRVRRVAIRKLDDPGVLEHVAASDSDPALRDLAAERLHEVLVAVACSAGPPSECDSALARLADDASLATVAATAVHEPVRRAALSRATTDRALRDIVRRASDAAIRDGALARISDTAVLRAIAVGEGPADVALLAIDRIQDAATLRAIADNRAAARPVRQRARARLTAAGAPARDFKATRARQLELCTMVHALRADTDVLRAFARVDELRREWQELASTVQPRDDVAGRFGAACEAIESDAASLLRRRAAVEGARTVLDEQLAARRVLCERVEELDGADALRGLAEARDAWGRLAAVTVGESAELGRRFAAAVQACEVRHQRWLAGHAVEELVVEAEAFADADTLPPAKAWKALEQRWIASASGPDVTVVLRDRFARASERLQARWREAEQRDEERRRKNVARLEALCARLDELTQSPSLKPGPARRALEEADAALLDLGPLPAAERRTAWSERLDEARSRVLRRLGELEETEQWRRWANTSAQEEIIARVEALLESNDLREGTRQLGRLQEEWEKVATATPDKSQALWERFRTARTELRRRCDAYLAENLEQKMALCEQAAALGDSTSWNETTEQIKRLQAEWKAIGPVPAQHAGTIWKRFREPCEHFFARRKEHFDRVDGERRENANRRASLCERAEALAESTSWEETATAIKQLQAEWKRIGPAPRAEADALWGRFRAACDRFFDRHRRRHELAREAAQARARAICEDLERLAGALGGADADPAESVARRLDEAWGEWLRLEPAGLEDAQALDDRLRAACERIAAANPECLRGTRLDPDATRKAREKLCQRLEELGAMLTPAPRAMSLQEMALALRERLATNTIAGSTGGQANRQDAARELERISASWSRLGPPLGDDGHALAERFARARTGVLEAVAERSAAKQTP